MTCKFHASKEGGQKYQDTCGECIKSGPSPDAPTQAEVDSAMSTEEKKDKTEETTEEKTEEEHAPVPRGSRRFR